MRPKWPAFNAWSSLANESKEQTKFSLKEDDMRLHDSFIRALVFGGTLVLANSLATPQGQGQTVTVVNMIPKTSSGETSKDTEPSLAVNPLNPLQIVATAFTPDPAGTAGIAPIYLSADGGLTWTLYSIMAVPTSNLCPPTCDVTLRFGDVSGVLYLTWLSGDSGTLAINLNVTRLQPFPPPPPSPTILQTTVGNLFTGLVDQPFTRASTALTGAATGKDRVYVGANDTIVATSNGGTGDTASFDQSLDAATAAAPAGFGAFIPLDARTTCNQDGPQIRPAIHPSGRIYAAFYRWTSNCGSTSPITTDVVVIRDDNWGTGTAPYRALTDSDTLAGKRVITGVVLPKFNTTLGTERVAGSLSIAVDPNDNQKVWIVWADCNGATTATCTTANYTLHVRASSDGGATWGNDLKTVALATNPALAVNTQSGVGLLYQKWVAAGTCSGNATGLTGCWETHLETTNDGATWSNLTLANTPQGPSGGNFALGDYDYLMAVGKDFYGIFSADNAPFAANFPQGVVYQRFSDLTTAHSLFSNAAHTTAVSSSVDPFFFSVSSVPAKDDFYVRDWTNSLTSHDNGEEPSTNPVWWTTSDVWNRLTNTAGAFTNDQPSHENAQDASSGHNFAFVRVNRKAAAPAGAPNVNVTARFLFADYGLGVNYEDVTGAIATSSAPLTFTASQTELNLPDGAGVQWDLPTTRSTHICLAVEISTPADPYAPELAGRAPGWPTDLLLTTDNNKAQRNMDLPPLPQTGTQVPFFAIVHNAAMFRRDITVRYEMPEESLHKLRSGELVVVGRGGQHIPLETSGTLVLSGMEPGENRWLGVLLSPRSAEVGDSFPVTFHEVVGGASINGFTIAPSVRLIGDVLVSNLKYHRAAFTRLAESFHINGAAAESQATTELLKTGTVNEKTYVEFLASNFSRIDQVISELLTQRPDDAFGIKDAVSVLKAALPAGHSSEIASAHLALLNGLDAFQTLLQKTEGDPADILQMVRWQRDLYSSLAYLRILKDAHHVVEESDEFIRDFERRKRRGDSYPELIRELLPSFRETAEALERLHVKAETDIAEMKEHLKALPGLEKAHRSFLIKLAAASE
jgi:hypothetical protein